MDHRPDVELRGRLARTLGIRPKVGTRRDQLGLFGRFSDRIRRVGRVATPSWSRAYAELALPAELGDEEYRAGRRALARKIRKYSPRWVAILGLGAYRTGFGRPEATIGRQIEKFGSAGLWVLPNPSGLNANYQLPQLIRMFDELRIAAETLPGIT